jgi:broad specificity phosphatase PhoE
MLTVRFIRHGESLANAGGVTAEPDAVPLTLRGREQAEAISRGFTTPPDLIVTSPYVRAHASITPTTSRFPQVPIEIWPVQEIEMLARARRIHTSSADRRPWIEDYWARGDPDYVDGPGAESYREFVGRVRTCLARLASLADTADAPNNITIFGHGQFMKAVYWEITEAAPPITPDTMRAFFAAHIAAPIANAESLLLHWDGAGWLIKV